MCHWLVKMQKSCTFLRNKTIPRHNHCHYHWTSIQPNQHDFHHNVHVISLRAWFQTISGINVTSISPLMLHRTIRNLASIHMSPRTIAKMPCHWTRPCSQTYQVHSVDRVRITCIWICRADNGHSTTSGCRMDWMHRITSICGWRHAKSGTMPMQKVKLFKVFGNCIVSSLRFFRFIITSNTFSSHVFQYHQNVYWRISLIHWMLHLHVCHTKTVCNY